MKVLTRITLLEPLTQAKIDDLIVDEDLVVVQVDRAYPCGDVPETLTLTLPAQVGETFLASLKDVIDECSYVHESEANVFVAVWESGVIDLSGSYTRAVKDTSEGQRPIVHGKTFEIIFTVGGLSGVKKVSGVLSVGSVFPSKLKSDLLDVGIEVDDASTSENIIINAAGCGGFMVDFRVPYGEWGKYIFDYDFNGKILSL